MDTSPIVLPSNRPQDRFYRGGRRITDFRGDPAAGPNEPEDWIASTTEVLGSAGVGRTVLPDGRRLVDAVEADPVSWLGAEHVARWGSDPRLLVKLLDAGQRLPVHAHPGTGFAGEHLGHAHGKAEAWFILEPGTVFLGLRRDVGEAELRALVDDQRVEELLALLNPIEVRAGDAVLVPPGELHAIGEGVLLLEVQEPEDLSILLEWRDFALDGTVDGHLGLGFDVALTAVRTRATTGAALDALVRRAGSGTSALPDAAAPWFSVQRIEVAGAADLEPGYAVLVVERGALELGEAHLGRGATVVLPHAAGAPTLRGEGVVLVCRPGTD